MIAAAADRNDWIAVPVTDQFRHHGYCADGDTTSFRSYSGSKARQGDKLGTAHPNHRGLGVVARVVKAAMDAS